MSSEYLTDDDEWAFVRVISEFTARLGKSDPIEQAVHDMYALIDDVAERSYESGMREAAMILTAKDHSTKADTN